MFIVQAKTTYHYICAQCGKRTEMTVDYGSISIDVPPSFPQGWRSGGTVSVIYFEGDNLIKRVAYVRSMYNGQEVGVFCSEACEMDWARERTAL